jgi:hypothetical protein
MKRILIASLLMIASASICWGQAQAAPRPQCALKAGRQEVYSLMGSVKINIWRYYTADPNNCAEDFVGHIEVPSHRTETLFDDDNKPYIADTWDFNYYQTVMILHSFDPKFVVKITATLDSLNKLIDQMVGTTKPYGEDPRPYMRPDLSRYSPWQIESDRRFDDGVDWIHAREVVLVRNPPPPPPEQPQVGEFAHYRLIQDPVRLRVRKEVDACNNQTYIMLDTGNSDYWINSLQVHCDDLSKRTDR